MARRAAGAHVVRAGQSGRLSAALRLGGQGFPNAGAGSGTRTHTGVSPAEFESAASTDSAIPAWPRVYRRGGRACAPESRAGGQAAASVASAALLRRYHSPPRSEERRVGKRVDLGGRSIRKKRRV